MGQEQLELFENGFPVIDCTVPLKSMNRRFRERRRNDNGMFAKEEKLQNEDRGRRFLKAAENVEKKIKQMRNSPIRSLRLTPRRLRIIRSQDKEIEELEKLRIVLQGLGEDWIDGTVSPVLSSIKTKKTIHNLLRFPTYPGISEVKDDFFAYGINRENFHIIREELLSYLSKEKASAEDLLREAIRRAEFELMNFNIPGYWPTPENIIRKLFDAANIEDGMWVLEPGAGRGDIVDYVLNRVDAHVFAFEINPKLCDLLRLKAQLRAYEYEAGETVGGAVVVVEGDFLEMNSEEIKMRSNRGFDRVIMNPPFEVEHNPGLHIITAFEYLKEGGILVSVIPQNYRYSSRKDGREFNGWLEAIRRRGCSIYVEDLGSFGGASNTDKHTGVYVQMLKIKKL